MQLSVAIIMAEFIFVPDKGIVRPIYQNHQGALYSLQKIIPLPTRSFRFAEVEFPGEQM